MLTRIKGEVRKWRNAPPPERWLKEMIESRWVDYQAWLFHYTFLSKADWLFQRKNSRRITSTPLLSIVTPVYNVHPDFLQVCVDSVLFQSYPYWELVLVDDCSSNPETLSLLEKLSIIDRRIKVYYQEKNQGICRTTNYAISQAEGKYVIFLDHDDKLAPNALYELSNAVAHSPEIDIVYSDRDMIAENGTRFMHLFKPGWAPETILSSNYLCHLTSYRKSLLEKLDGLDAETEGSQDHDLILRAEETQPHIHHIPKVLYHWRQHQESVSLNPQSKDYAYNAAELSIDKALKRRGLRGSVEEIAELWRGNYRVQLHPPSNSEIYVHSFEFSDTTDFPTVMQDALLKADSKPYLVFLDRKLFPINSKDIQELVSWFQIPQVVISTGKIVDTKGKIVHAGLVSNSDGDITSIYQGLDEKSTPGYMAWAATAHNVSLPHPGCFAMRNKHVKYAMEQLSTDMGPQGGFSISLLFRSEGKRILYTPFARFCVDDPGEMYQRYSSMNCRNIFDKWQGVLSKGDPYFSNNLMIHNSDIALNFSSPPFIT
ncbi:MAG: glycosyltransferase [Bacteroidetes bacterium]|nr:glycosyltransferase [Bacteroidota bacterium]